MSSFNDDSLGIIRKTEEGIVVEPLGEDGAALIREVKDQEGHKKVTIKSEAPEDCPLEPELPTELTLCAALQDLKAAREGEMDLLTLLERLTRREVLRDKWDREGMTEEVSEGMRKLEDEEGLFLG